MNHIDTENDQIKDIQNRETISIDKKEFEDIKNKLQTLQLCVDGLGIEDILGNKIFSIAKDKFSNWFYFSVAVVVISNITTIITFFNSAVIQTEKVKTELIEEIGENDSLINDAINDVINNNDD